MRRTLLPENRTVHARNLQTIHSLFSRQKQTAACSRKIPKRKDLSRTRNEANRNNDMARIASPCITHRQADRVQHNVWPPGIEPEQPLVLVARTFSDVQLLPDLLQFVEESLPNLARHSTLDDHPLILIHLRKGTPNQLIRPFRRQVRDPQLDNTSPIRPQESCALSHVISTCTVMPRPEIQTHKPEF